MTSKEIAAKIVSAHRRALADRHRWVSRTSGLDGRFHNLQLYGRDAGTDFAVTHLALIVEEAERVAESRQDHLDIGAYGFGKAAIEGVADTLRERTGLSVEIVGKSIRVSWGQGAEAVD